MAGTLIVNPLQIGDSTTPSQNFHLKSNIDGTISLNRGNAGTPIQTVLSIDTLGNVVLPVYNNTGASSDVSIPVGGTAKIDVTSATSVPLRISTGTDQIYQIMLFGNSSITVSTSYCAFLAINNTNYPVSQFIVRQIYSQNATAGGNNITDPNTPGFRFDVGGASPFDAIATAFTKTSSKRWNCSGSSSTTSTAYNYQLSTQWGDTTTPWTSLGTVYFPSAWTGTIVIKRIL